MGLILKDRYPSKVDTTDAAYPQGKAQNITTTLDGTGTPWEKDLVNDIMGLQQAIYKEAGITPSGTPDTADVSQQLEGIKKIVNINDLSQAYEFDTVSLGKASTIVFPVNKKIHISEYHASGLGGGEWIVINTGTTTGVDLPNDINIVQFSSTPTLSIRLQVLGLMDFRSFGAIADNVFDNKATIEAASAVTNSVMMCSSAGTFYISTAPTLPVEFTTYITGQTAISGVSAVDAHVLMATGGNLQGYAVADDLRYSGIEIICGTVKQNGGKTVTSITRVGSVATCTQTAHSYSNGDLVNILGANETEYNVIKASISNVTANTYNFTVAGTPATPATGSVTAGVYSRWDWISDSGHTPIGVDSTVPVSASGATLSIPFKKTYSRVLSMVVAPDEAFANGLSVSVGPSTGLSSIDIKASAQVTMAGHAAYDGASWNLSYGAGQGGDIDFNAEITSVASVVANHTFSHTWVGGEDLSITADTNAGAVIPWIPVTRSVDDTSFVVNFIDYSGAFVMSADTKMSFRFSKQFSQGIRMDGVNSGNDLDLWLGNIWFYGIMEV